MDPHRGAFSSIVFWWVFFVVILSCQIGATGSAVGICETKGCNCVNRLGGWKVVNCTFELNQDVVFEADAVHSRLLEVFIVGGNSLVFGEKSINALPGLSILYIGNTKEIVIRKHAFYNSSSASLRFEVENCDKLVIESEAFVNSDSTLIIEVNRAKYCIVLAAAFSKLLNATFQNIDHMDLVERTFEITKKDGIVRHGLVTRITFNNVKLSKIPTKTFFSSLAEIRIQDCIVDEIQTKAFSGTQITSIVLTNSTVKYIDSEACPSNSLIQDFKISRCPITKVQTKAVVCAVTNFTIQNSRIQDIETGAVNTTAAFVNLVGNEIVNVKPFSLGFSSWNKVIVEQNMIKNLGDHFIYGEPTSQSKTDFSFINNDIFNLDNNSLFIISTLEEDSIEFRDNYFNIKCHCFLREWLGNLTRTNRGLDSIMNTSFCTVDDLLSRCYELKTGSISMTNFTKLVCSPGSTIKCEHYNGKEKILNITNPVFLDAPKQDHSWLILTLALVGLVIIASVATFIFLIISGGRWLKRKGYFRNMHYSPNETSNDEENTIVTMDQDSEEHKLDLPEELTLEYLEYLKKRLDDPNTHQETSDMIERLYEMFIIEDNYDNNNRQDEELHLYEELANMQNPPGDRKSAEASQNGPLSILRMMEERFNLQYIDTEEERPKTSPLVNEYSEPSDAAVHLYSELKQNQIQNEKNEKKDSLKSGGSGSMVARPLPNKPDDFYNRAGPSSMDD